MSSTIFAVVGTLNVGPEICRWEVSFYDQYDEAYKHCAYLERFLARGLAVNAKCPIRNALIEPTLESEHPFDSTALRERVGLPAVDKTKLALDTNRRRLARPAANFRSHYRSKNTSLCSQVEARHSHALGRRRRDVHFCVSSVVWVKTADVFEQGTTTDGQSARELGRYGPDSFAGLLRTDGAVRLEGVG